MRISDLQETLCILFPPITSSREQKVKKNIFLHNDSFLVSSLLLQTHTCLNPTPIFFYKTATIAVIWGFTKA